MFLNDTYIHFDNRSLLLLKKSETATYGISPLAAVGLTSLHPPLLVLYGVHLAGVMLDVVTLVAL